MARHGENPVNRIAHIACIRRGLNDRASRPPPPSRASASSASSAAGASQALRFASERLKAEEPNVERAMGRGPGSSCLELSGFPWIGGLQFSPCFFELRVFLMGGGVSLWEALFVSQKWLFPTALACTSGFLLMCTSPGQALQINQSCPQRTILWMCSKLSKLTVAR